MAPRESPRFGGPCTSIATRSPGYPWFEGLIRKPFSERLWVDCLAKAGAGADAWAVSLFLLYETWRTKTRVVKLTNAALAQLGVGRQGKSRALQQLRGAGLVAVEERRGRSPLVTVRFVEM